MSKNCLKCSHCSVEAAEPGYSEVTPGGPFSIECYKNMWDFDEYSLTKNKLKDKFDTAKNCAHYEKEDSDA